MSEEEGWIETSDGFPTYRMWKIAYIKAISFRSFYKKYKRWLRKQRIRKFLGLRYENE